MGAGFKCGVLEPHVEWSIVVGVEIDCRCWETNGDGDEAIFSVAMGSGGGEDEVDIVDGCFIAAVVRVVAECDQCILIEHEVCVRGD